MWYIGFAPCIFILKRNQSHILFSLTVEIETTVYKQNLKKILIGEKFVIVMKEDDTGNIKYWNSTAMQDDKGMSLQTAILTVVLQMTLMTCGYEALKIGGRKVFNLCGTAMIMIVIYGLYLNWEMGKRDV